MHDIFTVFIKLISIAVMYLSLNNALFLMYTLFGGIFTCAKFRHQNEIDQNISTESIAVQWDNITVTHGSRTILSIGPGRLDKVCHRSYDNF